MSNKKGIYWDFYDGFKRDYPSTYNKLSRFIENEVNKKISNGEEYILAQELVGNIEVDKYQSEKRIPENIIHSLAGMELYKVMMKYDKWVFEKTKLHGRSFDQTIYFKKKRVSRNGN